MNKRSIGIIALNTLLAALLLITVSAEKVSAQSIPKNAQVYGQGWTCSFGYKLTADRRGCEKIDLPKNAQVYGQGWTCSVGYKKQGNSCIEMSVTEKSLQLKQIEAAIAASRNQTIKTDDEEFSLRDVARKCEVYRYSENYGEFECSGLRIVERKCEAYFSGYGDREGDIECSGSDLREIERHCVATMYSDDYAEIDC